MSRLRLFQGLICALAVPLAALGANPVGRAFTYQGELVLNGSPVSALTDLRLTLWDDPVAGAQIGGLQELSDVDIDGGRFTVLLNAGGQFGQQAFLGEARYLQIEVRSPAGAGPFTLLAPRQELTPAPFAIGLSLPFAGRGDSSTDVFQIVSTGLGVAGDFGVSNPASNSPAVRGSTDGMGPAGYFANTSGEVALVAKAKVGGTAVHGDTQGLANDTTAIYGAVTEPVGGVNNIAVHGENLSTHASAAGVRGDSVNGSGLVGVASDSGYGVYAEAGGDNGVGVYGEHTAGTGAGAGVHGTTRSTRSGAAGVRGDAPNPAGESITYGVYGTSGSDLGIGVHGDAATGVFGLGRDVGVSGEATGPGGFGVHGQGVIGVLGEGAQGVRGQAAANGVGVSGAAAGGDATSIGVRAVGAAVAGSVALEAQNTGGDGLHATGNVAIVAEGEEDGIRATTFDAGGVGGSFSNASGGVALRANGLSELNGNTVVTGTMSVNVLEIFGGADLAERFVFSEPAEAGMVVEIDPQNPGALRVSRSAYNPRVAGVISGANDLAAGVVLGEAPAGGREHPVALSGRVWVRCDTRGRGVAAGDLLTTSDLPGFAMPVGDPARATGAIIGKAMSSLAQGEDGMVLVLVNLH